jgi:hypothetical protein
VSDLGGLIREPAGTLGFLRSSDLRPRFGEDEQRLSSFGRTSFVGLGHGEITSGAVFVAGLCRCFVRGVIGTGRAPLGKSAG